MPIPPGAPLPGPDPREPRPWTWWLVLTGRVVVLAVAAASVVFALMFVRSSDRDRARAAAIYRCPMHPEMTAPVPAACPICGMALVRESAPGIASTTSQDAPDRARVDQVRRRVFAEDVRAPAWVLASGEVVAMLYRDDLVGLLPDQPARFFPATAPASGVAVALAAGPAVDWDSATASVRFQVIAPGGAAPSPGDQGLLVITARPRELLVVPASAVVNSPGGRFVFVIDPKTLLPVKRAVATGRTHQDVTAILSGVSDGDAVAVGNAFFLDAERRLRPEAAP
jgi:multidrug efflux pump subunit AcrA (membrane-fusion protein)